MKRSPMPRGSGFKPAHLPRLARQWDGDELPGPRPTVCAIDGLEARAVVAVPKFEYVRSEALMIAYRSISCQHCGTQDGTVCGAHSNWAIHGKGRSIKASDDRCASLCFQCHFDCDQGSTMTEPERRMFWWPAHVRTVRRLVSVGAWPGDVQAPSLTFPKEWT